MKHFLLAALFFLSVGKLAAQNEYMQNDPAWLCVHDASPWPCAILDTNNFYTDGDTLINTLTYKKLKSRGRWVYTSFISQAQCSYSEYSWQDSLAGCIRSSGKQMYWMPHGDTAEYLLWDFNLTIGSHTPVTYINTDTSYTVTAIDSIYTATGYRKVYYLNGSNFEYLIEGIGSYAGLMYHTAMLFEQYAQLVCYSQADTAYYPSQGPECFLITNSALEQREQVSLHLVPNPATEFVDVQLTGARVDLVEVFDARGQKVISQTQARIEVAELPAGIYLVKVSGDNFISSARMIVD